MSTFEKHINKLRNLFEEHKAALYPFENVSLRDANEYVKSLYFRMLCTLIRYTGEPNEMQVLYVSRLMAGSNAEYEFQDYMKMALNLEINDINEFISLLQKDDLKYYFCIDGSIILSVVETEDKNYELLAELVEMLRITREELKYLVSMAKAIVAQSSEMFDEAKSIASDTTKNLSMYHYISNFYTGTILDTSVEKYIYSCNKDYVNLSQHSTFQSKRVIIENISANLQDDVIFEGCSEVIIRNCKLIGNQYHFEFNRVGKIQIENCDVSDFTNRFIISNDANNWIICNNNFTNCGYTEDNDIRGGVILSNSKSVETIVLENNNLLNCYIARKSYKYNWGCTGIFISNTYGSPRYIKVKGNYFIGCQCRKNGNYKEAYVSGNAKELIDENNVCSGPVIRIFE